MVIQVYVFCFSFIVSCWGDTRIQMDLEIKGVAASPRRQPPLSARKKKFDQVYLTDSILIQENLIYSHHLTIREI